MKRVFSMGRASGKSIYDPFFLYKMNLDRVDRGYLEIEKVEKLMKHNFNTIRLEEVRDAFIFSCFTGMSYSDLADQFVTTQIKGWNKAQKIPTELQQSFYF